MIDPHVHLRDWEQSGKETVKHGLSVAARIGVTAVFDMPNTQPPLISREVLEKRIYLAKKAGSSVFYGVYMGLTADPSQIQEAVECYHECEQVVGFKLFAGKSTGDLSVPNPDHQLQIFKELTQLEYVGVVAVHCEKELLFRPNLWDPKMPETHSKARPVEAEIESVKDILDCAVKSGFMGHIHICHVSCPESVWLIEAVRKAHKLKISCGVTPHHLLLSQDMMNSEMGLLMKVNPPLRDRATADTMMELLLEGRIDWIESDHAPHKLSEKLNMPYASGLPGMPILSSLIAILKKKGADHHFIRKITHSRVCEVFGLKIPYHKIQDSYLREEYEFDVYGLLGL